MTNLVVQKTLPASEESDVKECLAFKLLQRLITTEQWQCKYLLRLFLIMLKESAKRFQSNTIYTDVLQLLQKMIDLAPWTKASSPDWQNLRQGLVIFFANNKHGNVKEMFKKLPALI